MADEIRNPMDVAAGQRTPMEYLQQLFGKPWGPPPEPTFEESATSTFPPGGVVGAGTPTIKPDISSLTGFENIGQPERAPVTSLPAPPAVSSAGPAPAALLPSATTPSPDQENMAMLRKLGASGLLPADFWAQHPDLAGGVAKVGEATPEQKAAREAQGLPDISGKLYSFLEPPQPKVVSALQGLMGQWEGALSTMLGGGRRISPGRMSNIGHTLATLMGTAQTGTKIPSEIAKNTREATLPLMHEVHAGAPGEKQTLMWTPGTTQPSVVAKGADVMRGAYSIDAQMIRSHTSLMENAQKVMADPLAKPEQQKVAQQQYMFSANYLANAHKQRDMADAYRQYKEAVLKQYPKATEEQIQESFKNKLAMTNQGQ